MSEEKPAYLTPTVLIGDSAALFADVRRKYREGLPGTWETAANWFRLSEVLDHAEAALAASQQHQADALDNAGYMTATAETVALRQQLATAQARIKEQQAELAEQEVKKLSLLRELRQAGAALHNATR